MKIFYSIFLLISYNCFCQITIRENINEKYIDNSQIKIYDSIVDFEVKKNHIDYLEYVGQDLFLPPQSKSKDEQYLFNQKVDKSKLIYNSKYKILNITSRKVNLREIPKNENISRLEFKLEDSLKNIVYFEKDLDFADKSLYPFILDGFYKMNLYRYVNKELLVFKELERNSFIDINTGEEVKLERGTFWTCTSIPYVAVNYSETYRPFYILKNEKNEIKIKLGDLFENGFMSLDELNIMYNQWLKEKNEEKNREIKEKQNILKDCKNKFGVNICEKLLNNNIEIGMTKEMITYIYGQPFEIFFVKKQNLNLEIYNYGRIFFYFDKDKITMIKGYK